MIGTLLNQFRITARIGAGGMGEVYRARDTRLNRDVAIKVLPADFASDADRLRRFEQEARTLAALNHPNILTIHDTGLHDGTPYLVSELLEGRTLREELASGQLSMRKATDYALQIANGLAAAHARGIIHRDLKPENIFISKDGRVKILDFGLAKLSRNPHSATGSLQSCEAPTLLASTFPGVILGTPAYMSPEQVRGESSDHRSDIFSFGCVLAEMLIGQAPFRRDTAVESMTAVLKGEPPDFHAAGSNIPQFLAQIVDRCLQKSPENRFQSAKDLHFALSQATSSQPRLMAIPAPRTRPALAAGLALIALSLATITVWQLWPDAPSTTGGSLSASPISAELLKSVAVRPFDNRSAALSDDYLSDGLTEELLNALVKIKGLRVPGRSSSFAFKGKSEEDIFRRMGEQLKVGAILEGSVRKAGDKLRVTANLVNVADGFSLWSETYDHDMTNIFAIQSDIAARVAQALKVQLLGAAETVRPTENIEAYQHSLRARQLWNQRTPDAIRDAIRSFERALVLDPRFARAYAGLADCYAILEDYDGTPASQTYPKAREAALRALELDPILGQAYAALAMVSAYWEWNWSKAEAEFRRAIELNPNYATTSHWYANLLASLGRDEEALQAIQRARHLDPLSPIITAVEAKQMFNVGDREEALARLRRQASQDPTFLQARFILGSLYIEAGNYAEAVDIYKPAREPIDLGFLGFALARDGQPEAARRVLDRLAAFQQEGRSVSLCIAAVQNGLGQEQEALDFLEKALAEKSTALADLPVSARWANLRSHPRFQSILHTMNVSK